jgi:hypothetical protein
MPRFYFDFKEDNYLHVDDLGHEPGVEQAEEEASVAAASLLKD